MTQRHDPPPHHEPHHESGHESGRGPRRTAAEVRDVARLRRTVTDRKVAGVAGGLARHLDIDPVIVRVALVVLIFFGGAGLILYAGLWLLVPREGTPDAPLGLDDHHRSIAVLIVGGLAALALIGDSAGAFWFPWPIAIVALIVVLILNRRDRRRAATASGPASPTSHDGTYGGTSAVARPRNPRKQGPLFFWFTLALVVVAVGVLAMADLAGMAVPPRRTPHSPWA